jgi:signal transduction histidine kinase
MVASSLSAPASAQLQKENAARDALTRIEASGSEYIMLTTPLADITGQPVGELRILRSFETAREHISILRRNIVLIWLFAVLLGLWSTSHLARRILKPVQELDRGAAEVSRGNYDYRAPVADAHIENADELGRLAQAFNTMCASIQSGRQELIRQERLNTIGRMSTSIVHDLRNPLAAIYGGAEMLMDKALSPEQVRRLADNIYRSSRRVQQILQELADSRRGKGNGTEVCRLKDVIAAAYDVYSGVAEAQSVAVKIDVPDEIQLPLERARMERVFVNLIDNALGAMPGGGRLAIAAQISGDEALVRVQDSGPGILPQIRENLFQPFVTAGKKNGLGLGLAFSHQTVLDHGGDLWAGDETGEGACFFLRLPLQS